MFKFIFVPLLVVALSTKFGLGLTLTGHHLSPKRIPMNGSDLPDGLYNINSVKDNYLIGAFNLGAGGGLVTLGEVSSELHDPVGNVTVEQALRWHFTRDTFAEEDDIYYIRTDSTNNLNNLDLDLPAGPGSFPVFRRWRLRNWDHIFETVVGLNAVPFFADDNQNLCLRDNGLHQVISFVDCDDTDEHQHWWIFKV